MNFNVVCQIVTAVAAFVGMGLGIYNFWMERSKQKVKILVQPKAVMRRLRNPKTGAEGFMTSVNEFKKESVNEYFAIEAVNLSSFPVTIDIAGFELLKDKNRMMLVQPILMDDGPWPRRLDQRESVILYGLVTEILKDPRTPGIRNAFVETSCGNVCRGTSGALEEMVNYAAELQEKRAT